MSSYSTELPWDTSRKGSSMQRQTMLILAGKQGHTLYETSLGKMVHCFNVNSDSKRDLEKCLELIMQPSAALLKLTSVKQEPSLLRLKTLIRAKQGQAPSQKKKHYLHWVSLRHINKE